MNESEQINYFAETDTRNRKVRFGIKAKDRTKHVYVIGKTGMGKSTLLENMAVQDIKNGNGFSFIDPHGKTADLLLEYVPKERIEDVLYFAPFDMEYPVSFNVMEDVGFDKRHLVVSGLMSAFKKIWQDAWSARMEYILNNTLLALLEFPGATLLQINRMYSDKIFRNQVVENVTDPTVKTFWTEEFAKYTDRFAAEATPAIQNKIGQFTSNPLIRNIIGQSRSSFDIRKMMDDKKILIINLSKGRVGESNANLLGGMLITKIYLAAMSRADIHESELTKLPNFYLFVDEFQSFANESFADILSEARKYKLNLTIAHQYIEQMTDEVRAAVFGNVGTMITFRVGSYDADILEKEFAPTFEAQDLVNLGFTQIYLKLMIDGIGSQPFSASTLPPIQKQETSFVREIIESSRRKYSMPRSFVEENIKKSLEVKKDESVQQYERGNGRDNREDHDGRRNHDRREGGQKNRNEMDHHKKNYPHHDFSVKKPTELKTEKLKPADPFEKKIEIKKEEKKDLLNIKPNSLFSEKQISLEDLKKQEKFEDQSKTRSSEKANELRNILQKYSEKQNDAQAVEIQGNEKGNQKHTNINTETQKENLNVSEKDLKKVLGIDQS